AHRSSPVSAWSEPSISEQRFDGELNLPRRSGIAGRKPRVGDDPERRSAHDGDAVGLSEISPIEEVERFDAKLQARGPGHSKVCDNRQVCIADSGPVQRVSAEIAEMEYAARRLWQRKHRARRARTGNARIAYAVVEPLGRGSDDAWIADEIGPQRVNDAS